MGEPDKGSASIVSTPARAGSSAPRRRGRGHHHVELDTLEPVDRGTPVLTGPLAKVNACVLSNASPAVGDGVVK